MRKTYINKLEKELVGKIIFATAEKKFDLASRATEEYLDAHILGRSQHEKKVFAKYHCDRFMEMEKKLEKLPLREQFQVLERGFSEQIKALEKHRDDTIKLIALEEEIFKEKHGISIKNFKKYQDGIEQ